MIISSHSNSKKEPNSEKSLDYLQYLCFTFSSTLAKQSSPLLIIENELILINAAFCLTRRFYFPAQQTLNLSNNKWRFTRSRFPIGVWGHCSVKGIDGHIYTTGGLSDYNTAENLRSMFKTTLSGLKSERLPSMKIGRTTHSCLSTKYWVSELISGR